MVDGGPVVFPARDLPALPALRSLIPDIGPLGDPDDNGVRLPAGFTSRVVARAGQTVPGTDNEWHPMPDGGATFITEDETLWGRLTAIGFIASLPIVLLLGYLQRHLLRGFLAV